MKLADKKEKEAVKSIKMKHNQPTVGEELMNANRKNTQLTKNRWP